MDFVFQRRKGEVVPARRWMEEKERGYTQRETRREQSVGKIIRETASFLMLKRR